MVYQDADGNEKPVAEARNWEPPKDVKPWMVCAACRWDGAVENTPMLLGPRHWDKAMHNQADQADIVNRLEWEQGFIDQWGRFYTREEAMKCVKASGQPFNNERNGGHETELFSEGLY